MLGTLLYGPRDVRIEERSNPTIIEPNDALIRIAATCVCGSDLWPYRGIEPLTGPIQDAVASVKGGGAHAESVVLEEEMLSALILM